MRSPACSSSTARSFQHKQPHPALPTLAATDSLTVLPGFWVMPNTAATLGHADARSLTAANSKNQRPSGKFISQPRRNFQREAGLADRHHNQLAVPTG